MKSALPGFRHLVDWWDLPTRLEWALAPDRGAGVTKLGPWLDAWPSGVCVGLGSRTKALFPWVQAALAACVYQTH